MARQEKMIPDNSGWNEVPVFSEEVIASIGKHIHPITDVQIEESEAFWSAPGRVEEADARLKAQIQDLLQD